MGWLLHNDLEWRKFTQQCWWKLKCSATLHCVVGWVFPDVSTDSSDIIFRAKQYKTLFLRLLNPIVNKGRTQWLETRVWSNFMDGMKRTRGTTATVTWTKWGKPKEIQVTCPARELTCNSVRYRHTNSPGSMAFFGNFTLQAVVCVYRIDYKRAESDVI
jgi:hypothetical protein